METYNSIYTVKYADITSTTANTLWLIFDMANGDEVKFNIQATEPINILKLNAGTITGNPETSIKQQGTRELVIIYDDTTDQNTHEGVINALLPVGITVTIAPASISTLATLAEQQTQTTKLDSINTNVGNMNVILNNIQNNQTSGIQVTRIKPDFISVITDHNVRTDGTYQTGYFFSCELTIISGTLRIFNNGGGYLDYPLVTSSGTINSVSLEAPYGQNHFDVTYQVISGSVLEVITKAP